MNNSDNVYSVSSKLHVKKSEIHGIGVFAAEDIPKGELLEISRLLKLEWRMKYQYDKVLRDYSWVSNCQCKECQTHGQNMFLALGFGSLYNHSDSPNTNMEINYANQTLIVVAKEDIKQGDEVFVSYGANYWKTRSKT